MKRNKKIRLGVLALQGAFALHRQHIEALGAEYKEVVDDRHFNEIDGLILPGGESSAMLKLIDFVGLERALCAFLSAKPAWGICAGAILMAREVTNPSQKSYGVIDMVIERNSYGRQVDSIQEVLDGCVVSYIRAPRIIDVGQEVLVLSKRDDFPTWVESQRSMVTTFHPELGPAPSPWHQRFLARTISASSNLLHVQ